MASVGIVVTAFNRPLLLLRTLHDLSRTDRDGLDVRVVIVDDGSIHPLTRLIVDAFTMPGAPVRVLHRPQKPLRAAAYLLPVVAPYFRDLSTFTVHEALRDGFDEIVDGGVEGGAPELLVNVDADLRLRPDWLTTMTRIFRRERYRRGPLLLTGFHTAHHPVVDAAGDPAADHVEKASVGGANLMFDVELYQTVIRPALTLHWDWHVVETMRQHRLPMLCTRPSVVQHVGRRGRFSRPGAVDEADDFRVLRPG